MGAQALLRVLEVGREGKSQGLDACSGPDTVVNCYNQNLNPDLTPKPGAIIQLGEIKYGELSQLPATQLKLKTARAYFA